MASKSLDLLSTLKELLQKLDPTSPLQEGLDRLLAETSRMMEYKRMSLALFDSKSNTLKFSIVHGNSRPAEAVYSPGQGVSGEVLSTGAPIIVPLMKDHPRFLNLALGRTKSEMARLSFISVPVPDIKENDENPDVKALGVLSVDLDVVPQKSLQEHCAFLEVLAAVIARQAAYLQENLFRCERWEIPGLENSETNSQHLLNNKIVATSKSMAMIMGQVMQVSGSKATVLIRGESGTGKELLAEAIHNTSPRARQAFIKLNCATLPAHLVESELFGHVRGAFTGAVDNKKGRFELAHKGTLFLDEIGELSADAQAKLLRALQEGEIQRVGSEKVTNIDVRIICATHQPLEKLIEDCKFREDLYYRINVFPLFIPALRERREDILPLAEHFLNHFATEYKKEIGRISTPAIDLLTQYHWPGNIRELRNCIERAVLLCTDKAIRTYHLPPTLQTAESSASDIQLSFGEAVSKFEQEIIIEALKKAKGNMLQAAKDMRSSYRIINYKVKKYHIDPKKYNPRK